MVLQVRKVPRRFTDSAITGMSGRHSVGVAIGNGVGAFLPGVLVLTLSGGFRIERRSLGARCRFGWGGRFGSAAVGEPSVTIERLGGLGN